MLDLLLRNGTVHTMDRGRPRAHSIGIWHGRVVGVDEQVTDLSALQVVDLDGATVLPGFHDAHCHTTSFGVAASQLELSGCANTTSILDRVAQHAAALPTDAWVIGVGYLDREDPQRHPTTTELDRAASGRPVWLTHRSGHMCVVSTAVLGLLPDPLPQQAERYVEVDPQGRPTGLLEEAAMELVKDAVGPASVEDIVEAIGVATHQYVREGITSFTEAGIGCPGVDHSPLEIAAWQIARQEGKLQARAQLMVYSELLHALPGHPADAAKLGLDLGLHTGLGDPWLRLGAMKIWLDGAGSAGRAASSARDGDAEDRGGNLVDDPLRLTATIIAAHHAGWQVAAHAMGDLAVDLLLDALERSGPTAQVRRRRHRIEHAGLIRPDQIDRIRHLGVVVAIQPAFIPEFGDSLSSHFGEERVGWSIRGKSLGDAGIVVAASSDRPVAPGAPLGGIQDMTQRLTASGVCFGPDERVPVLEAIRAYTSHAAFAAHSESELGTLTSRRLADMVVLEEDPIIVEPSAISKIEILATVVDGKTVHDPGRLIPELD